MRRRHYQTQSMHVKLYSAVHKEAPSVPVLRRVCECCAVVYREGTERQQQTAALYQIVSLSLHNEFKRARDLLLMTHLQERIYATDQALAILFNRAMTQLGLAAFRAGAMAYTHNCLDDLVNLGSRNGMLPVLLAQKNGVNEEEVSVLPAKLLVPAHMVRVVRARDA